MAIYKRNSRSKVFALLADLYRKQGDLDKALDLCRRGIKEHPQFTSGHIASALIFLDMNKLEMAVESLEKATDLSSENIFAYKMLGQTWLKLKNPEKTLQAYKMVLFLDPTNKKAESIIKKLESMTAVQYDKTGFAFKNLEEVAQYIAVPSTDKREEDLPTLHPIPKVHSKKEKGQFEARSSMIEALIYRKEFSKARQFLQEMKNIYAHRKEWDTHIKSLERKLPLVDKKPQSEKEQHGSFPTYNTVFASVSDLDKKSKNPRLDTSTAYFNHSVLDTSQKTITQDVDVNQKDLVSADSEKALSSEEGRGQPEYSTQANIRSQEKQKKIKKLRRLLARIEHFQSQVAHQP